MVGTYPLGHYKRARRTKCILIKLTSLFSWLYATRNHKSLRFASTGTTEHRRRGGRFLRNVSSAAAESYRRHAYK